MRIGAPLLALCAWTSSTPAAESRTIEHKTTLAELFPANEVTALARTLPADRVVTFRVRAPGNGSADAVFIFVAANDSGELPDAWTSVMDEKRLMWIAANGYGNTRLSAERVLVALMAVRLAERLLPPQARRLYVAGYSGGGRVASRCITLFASYFDGALFNSGADFVKPPEPAATLMKSRRMVFLTGSGDFNRREMKSVAGRYGKAGVTELLLMDEPGLAHELATPEQLARAIDFLEAR